MIDDLYAYIDNWNGQRLFLYITILLFVIWYFSKKNIKLNVILGIIVAAFIISYHNHHVITTMDTNEKRQELKRTYIKPKINDAKNHDNIVNFLFSIQDLYVYNPDQYITMVRNINEFYDLFKICEVNKKSCYYNLGLMKQNKRDALNALMSLIFKAPQDKRAIEKINNATIILDDILTIDLDKISYMMDEYTYKNGYNVDTKIIDYETKPFNEYNDIFKNYSYEIY